MVIPVGTNNGLTKKMQKENLGNEIFVVVFEKHKHISCNIESVCRVMYTPRKYMRNINLRFLTDLEALHKHEVKVNRDL